jgi:hypothetical protein
VRGPFIAAGREGYTGGIGNLSDGELFGASFGETRLRAPSPRPSGARGEGEEVSATQFFEFVESCLAGLKRRGINFAFS